MPDSAVSTEVMLAQQDRYMSNRAKAMQQVERSLTEIQGMFQQLAILVADQEPLVHRLTFNLFRFNRNRIDEHVDEAVQNTERSQDLLRKELDRVSKNRWLIIKVFGIVLFFAVIFILFFL